MIWQSTPDYSTRLACIHNLLHNNTRGLPAEKLTTDYNYNFGPCRIMNYELQYKIWPSHRINIAMIASRPVPSRCRAVELTLRLPRRERINERFVEQIVLPDKEEIAEKLQFTPQERGPDRIAKQMADILVPPSLEETVPVVQEVAKLGPQERVQQSNA